MKIYEIGVGNPDICRTKYNNTDECYLFEANPNTYSDLMRCYSSRDNFKIYNCAIGDIDGKINFSVDGDSSYLTDIKSPTVQCAPNEYVESRNIIEVDCFRISNFDNGDIDLMLLDMEGSEFYVLKHLISRPKTIIIELDNNGRGYINPYYNEIVEWMQNNYYDLTDKNEDGIFVKRE